MAGSQERVLKRRVKSVQSTRKTTRAMELIAASRIVRAQARIAAARPYSELMGGLVAGIASSPVPARHVLLGSSGGPAARGDAGPAAGGEGTDQASAGTVVVVIVGDRGLSGAYNTNVLRAAEGFLGEQKAASRVVSLVTAGRKAQSYFRYRNLSVEAAFDGMADQPSYEDAARLAAPAVEAVSAGRRDRVVLVSTRFSSIATQRVEVSQIVPVPEGRRSGGGRDYDMEPEPGELLDDLVAPFVTSQIFLALLEAAASEHAARQRAMKAATDNADELVRTLRRVMNRARQDAITAEIMDIVGGAEALRSAATAEQAS
ncbi:MAG: ATP synthase F1 subunit gamma [Acidimicrobiales bacterium]